MSRYQELQDALSAKLKVHTNSYPKKHYSDGILIAKSIVKDFLNNDFHKENNLDVLIEKAEKYDEMKTPKKPMIKERWWANDQCARDPYCPDCGEPLSKFKNNFCNKCGIKIDWSDEDDK